MPATHIAEVLNDGDTQTIRIPAELHLDTTVVEIRRNDSTGELILAPRRPRTWAEFFERLNQSEPEPTFMANRPLNTISVDRDIFADDAD